MRGLVVAFMILMTVGLAVWSYVEMNKTQVVLEDIDRLNQQIATSKSRLRKLNAEWAFQNRPERLEALALEYFDELGLVTLSKDHFAGLDEIAKQPEEQLGSSIIFDPVDVMDRGISQ